MDFKALGLLAVVLLGVGGITYWRYTTLEYDFKLEQAEVKRLNAEAANLRGANEANKLTIVRLERDRELDRQAIDRLTASVGEVSAKADRTRTIIREIERNDPAAASVLDTLLPVSVRNAVNAAPGR